MKHPNLTSDSAKKIYSSYINRVKKSSRLLSNEDQEDILMEINSHIHEGFERIESKDDVGELLAILDRLGEPEEFLEPMVAERKLKQATRTFNPKHVLQALALNVKSGVKFLVFSILYLFLGSFLILIGFKLFKPANTGMFFKDGEFQALGSLTDVEGYTEVLGLGFIPVCILGAVLFYFLITLIMRWTSK